MEYDRAEFIQWRTVAILVVLMLVAIGATIYAYGVAFDILRQFNELYL